MPTARRPPCATALDILAEIAARHTPEASQKITGIPADELVRLAHNFANLKGVVDDGWYSSKNGNDIELYQLINILNAFNGNVDREGGIVVTAGGGFKRPGVAAGKGPNGEKWDMVDAKRIDKMLSPESAGNLWAALDAMITGKPYPIRALFTVGTTLFHRESDSTRLAKALKTLDLLVVQDLLPHEVCDYADYVLPATYFLERRETAGVKWALDGSVHMNDAGIRPPEGVEARHDVWILLEILRRAYPERAERVGYKECKTADEFDAWWNKFDDKGIAKFVKDQEAKNPGSGEEDPRRLQDQGLDHGQQEEVRRLSLEEALRHAHGQDRNLRLQVLRKAGLREDQADQRLLPGSRLHGSEAPEQRVRARLGQELHVSPRVSTSSPRTARYTGDRTLWMNPYDAERLRIANKEKVMVEALDREHQAEVVVTVTKKVMAGSVFAFGFSGGVRTKELVNDPRFDFVKEGINSHWFATGYSAQPVVGNLANNSCIRVKRIKG
ncbi:MAG: molybdopterin-dependent oxidoreductase [Sutterella wadsworthensis]